MLADSLGRLASMLADSLTAAAGWFVAPLLPSSLPGDLSAAASNCAVEVTTVVGALVGVAGAGPRRALPVRYWGCHGLGHNTMPRKNLLLTAFSMLLLHSTPKQDYLVCLWLLQRLLRGRRF